MFNPAAWATNATARSALARAALHDRFTLGRYSIDYVFKGTGGSGPDGAYGENDRSVFTASPRPANGPVSPRPAPSPLDLARTSTSPFTPIDETHSLSDHVTQIRDKEHVVHPNSSAPFIPGADAVSA